MQKVRYRGTPIFGDDGEEYVEYLPGEKRYVGEPSDEIDEAWNELTKSHCIDHIRQQIMCQGDLTPLPSQYFESKGMNYLDSDREHTCRDFSRIRQWTHLRYNQSLTGDEVWTGHYKPGHEGTSSFGPV
ncbi:MAG: hypothetical protein LQ344_000366 [Seirophora lacunosa]|nr:MAG: hypothetical protein LQ344_000366 [Seirophora lacunosa]